MKKFNTLTAVLILISILLYATLALGRKDKGFPFRHSGIHNNAATQDSNLHDDSCLSDQNNNITHKAVFNLMKRLKLN